PQRPGKTIDERAAGAAEQVEQPGQGIHDQPDQGAEGLTEPFEGVGIYMHRSASGSVSGQGVTIAEVGGWSEGRCWLFPSLTPDPSPIGKTIDERAAGAAEQVEQPGQGIHDQPDQGAEGLTEPFEGVGIYMHRSASGSVSGQGVTIAEVGGWSEGRCWLFPSLTPDPS